MSIDTAGDAIEGLAIADRLAAWNRAYYDGNPAVTDEEWQKWRNRLAKVWPSCPLLRQVGAPVNPTSALKKAKHGIPMGSLSNAFEGGDILNFLRRVRLAAPVKMFVLQPKMDGLSVDLHYENGVLVQAITRGDGIEGEDVTHNLMRAKGVPHGLSEPKSLWVRGETVIHKDDLAKYFPDAANARNSAAGTVRRLDGRGSEHLRFYAFDAVFEDGTALDKTEGKVLLKLNQLGFTSAKCFILQDEDETALGEALLKRWQEFKTERLALPYDCDGFVCKVGNIAKSRALGEVDGCPKGMMAMKWVGSMVAVGKIRAVEASVGRSGAITPVGVLDPVVCGGVTITRVSLCNWDEVERLGICLGSEVDLERAGEVIPKVTRVRSSPPGEFVITRPELCPKCQFETMQDGPRQLCTNTECPARTFRAVLHFVNQRNILHLGDETIDHLMALDGPVQNIDDLYTLTEVQLAKACGGSSLLARKIMEALDKSRDVALHELLGSIGIPSLGHSEAKKLVKALKLRDVESFISACAAGLNVGIPGFGSEKAKKVERGTELRADLLRRLNKLLRVAVPGEETNRGGPLAGKSLCATGPSELPRNQIIQLITDAGGEWKSSVVAGLSYLIMADADSTTTKAEAARKKGVTCISEREFLDMIGFTG